MNKQTENCYLLPPEIHEMNSDNDLHILILITGSSFKCLTCPTCENKVFEATHIIASLRSRC